MYNINLQSNSFNWSRETERERERERERETINLLWIHTCLSGLRIVCANKRHLRQNLLLAYLFYACANIHVWNSNRCLLRWTRWFSTLRSTACETLQSADRMHLCLHANTPLAGDRFVKVVHYTEVVFSMWVKIDDIWLTRMAYSRDDAQWIITLNALARIFYIHL